MRESEAERRAPDATCMVSTERKKQLSKIAEFLSEGRIIYPVYQKSLSRLRLSAYQFNLAYFHTEKLGQNRPHGLVGLPFFRSGRDLNLQRIASIPTTRFREARERLSPEGWALPTILSKAGNCISATMPS